LQATTFWTSILQALLTNLAEGLIYFAIVLLFIAAFVKCVLPILRSRKQLRRAIAKVQREGGENAWQDKHFLGKGALMAQWCEYLNSRLFADDDYHNASPLDNYINEDTVIYEPSFTNFAEAVPGLLTSLHPIRTPSREIPSGISSRRPRYSSGDCSGLAPDSLLTNINSTAEWNY